MTGKVEQRWVVGTAEDCDVRVTDEYASLHHCEVIRTSAGFYVRDLGSINGTRIATMWTAPDGAPRKSEHRVYDWTLILPDQALIIGRSEIPWRSGGGS